MPSQIGHFLCFKFIFVITHKIAWPKYSPPSDSSDWIYVYDNLMGGFNDKEQVDVEDEL